MKGEGERGTKIIALASARGPIPPPPTIISPKISLQQASLLPRVDSESVYNRTTYYHGNANLTAPQAPKVHVSKLSQDFNLCGPGYPPNLFGFWI
eukprot:sb/3479250/